MKCSGGFCREQEVGLPLQAFLKSVFSQNFADHKSLPKLHSYVNA